MYLGKQVRLERIINRETGQLYKNHIEIYRIIDMVFLNCM